MYNINDVLDCVRVASLAGEYELEHSPSKEVLHFVSAPYNITHYIDNDGVCAK